ncbi:cupin domain-containing protein [Cellulomonas sp. Y8]|uniref:cupin domain-containing protein n=1 Tax=Cellulomonas sp. Y8 TaxID=2591145 RepID=UPI0011C7C5E8|nr:cupin domain-containing protein [Cellulomonas sp. Y8]
MDLDPVVTNADHYRVVLENARVRVLAYDDLPGDRTTPHRHPDSVMITRSAFSRRLTGSQGDRDVVLPEGAVVWLPAQEHTGENIGTTPTRVLLVELKDDPPEPSPGTALGPG